MFSAAKVTKDVDLLAGTDWLVLAVADGYGSVRFDASDWLLEHASQEFAKWMSEKRDLGQKYTTFS